jgi:Reverse transcriptase (RNA-dependent DNA polymerase)
LSITFALMFRFYHIPDDLTFGVIIPLIKDKTGDVTNTDNYRGITLNSTISKVFELCILNAIKDCLHTNEMQFGFKPKKGCRDAIFSVCTAINKITSNGNTALICTLDISKAFDKINHFGLLNKLLDRGIPKNITCFLSLYMSNSRACVKWNGVFSFTFSLQCGVRQGGLLSPFFFAVYIDGIFDCLISSGYGLYIRSIFYSCIMYADDMILISHSNYALQQMLSVCYQYISSCGLHFNVKKCAILKIGKQFKNKNFLFTIGVETVKYASTVKYLGLFFNEGQKINIDLHDVKSRFYKKFNWLYSKCACCDITVIMFLLKVYCIPILTYCLEVVPISNSALLNLDFCVNRCLFKIFGAIDLNCLDYLKVSFGILKIKNTTECRNTDYLYSHGQPNFFYIIMR